MMGGVGSLVESHRRSPSEVPTSERERQQGRESDPDGVMLRGVITHGLTNDGQKVTDIWVSETEAKKQVVQANQVAVKNL